MKQYFTKLLHVRTALALLLTTVLTMTAQTAWADSWPEYITDVVLVGGTESEAQTAKSGYSGYTWCSQRLNEGGDIIYIGYKTASRVNTNGGYITDFIIIDAGTGTQGHNPPSSLTFQGRTYYLCPAAGGDYFVNSNHGNLTSQAANGWNMYLYYTKANFSDKRAVSSITITKGEDTKSGSIDCYNKDGSLIEADISLNRGVSGTPFVYMHISTVDKTNRPKTDPVMASGLVYNGQEQMLVASMGTTFDNTYQMYFREIGGNQYFYENTSQFTKATNADTYNVEYFAESNDYGNQSATKTHQVTIAKSPNSGSYVTCSNYLEGTAPVPELKGTNLSSGTVTYKYSTSQNGTYTTTKPSAAGTYWVKATIAGDSNCYEYTTAATSFNIVYNWKLHNSGDTEDDAYVISTPSDLKYLAIWVNLGTNDFAGKFFKLGADIAFDKSKENNFTPIGNSNYSFRGVFDGKGHTISGLNINKPNNDNVGLFSNAGEGAIIKNLIVDNSTINGQNYVGAILGCGSVKDAYNYGEDPFLVFIENCLVTSSVSVSGNNDVGGIAGNLVAISGSVSAASVSGNHFVAGIIGGNGACLVRFSLYTGTSVTGTSNVGAITGVTSLGFTTNYYTADLSCKGVNGSDADGARKALAINKASGVTLTPTGTATTYNVSGITAYDGNNVIGYGTHLYAAAGESVNLDITYESPYEGFIFEGYTDGNGNALTHVDGNTYRLDMRATTVYITPDGQDLWGETDGTGRDGTTAEKAYRITTPEGLNLLAKKVNGTDGYEAKNYSGKYFELGEDIAYDKTVENNFTPIGNGSNYFSGHFDGKGHTVSGININMKATDYKGLFGNIHSSDGSVEVKNLTLDNSKIVGKKYCGGIACYIFKGTISNCHVTSSVAIYGSYNWADYHGGIVGYINQSNIIGCTSSADVTITSNESGMNYYGGIAGIIYSSTSSIQDCLVYGGTISGREYVGAVVGKLDQGTLTNNRYTGATTVNGSTGLGNGTGSGDVAGATFACAVIPYDGVTIAISGTPTTQYDYDGLKVYATGMSYGGMYYNNFNSGDSGDSGNVEMTATYTGTVPEDYALDGFGTTSLADDPDVRKSWDATGNTATFTLNTYMARDYYIAPVFRYVIWGDGDGSQGNAYIITTVGGLNKLSSEVNAGADLSGKYFELGADIEYDGTEGNFTAIGTESNRFKANFDGKGHTISGINLNTGNKYQGIFGFAEYCTIQNLTVSSSTIHGGAYTGGILGEGYGVIVSNCHVTSDVTLYGGNHVGGICGFGHYSSKIQGCTSAAKPTFRYNYYNGGIVGYMNGGTIKDCLYLGPQFDTSSNGAILGCYVQNYPTITNCYHTAYGMAFIGYDSSATNALFAVSSTTKPAAITGDATATYGTGTYQGITAYGTSGLKYNGRYYWHDDDLMVIDNDGTTNTTAINAAYNKTRNVVLSGRTLYKDGGWNTLCLPFELGNMSADSGHYFDGTPLEGAEVRKLMSAGIEGSTLTLTFNDPSVVEVNLILAGTPYIVKWPSGEDVKNPVFTGVKIYNDKHDFSTGSGDTKVQFIGTYDKVTFEELNRSILFVGAENTLYYPDGSDVTTIGACRAYFKIGDGANARQITDFDFNFDGGETTAVFDLNNNEQIINNTEWYTLDGRKLDSKPTQKGVYINNGRKVVVK